jgi:uncharacterized protein YjbI with pentapeptide repeats
MIQSKMSDRRTQSAIRRIDLFEKKFGKPHLYLAYYAAFPLTLTPDLVYRLWANFPKDSRGNELDIPWTAVADLLLSNLCEVVGYELYEMEQVVREELLRRLKADPNFSDRIGELADFLLEYLKQQLYSDNPDDQTFAQEQQWVALAYVRPGAYIKEIAQTLRDLFDTNSASVDKSELLRLASLVETMTEPLKGTDYEPLLTYFKGIESYAAGNLEQAQTELAIFPKSDKIEIQGEEFPIPKEILDGWKLPDFSRRKLCGRSFRGQDLTGANFSNADLRGANFIGAKLVGANFSNARMGMQQGWAIGLMCCCFLLTLFAGGGISLVSFNLSSSLTYVLTYVLAGYGPYIDQLDVITVVVCSVTSAVLFGILSCLIIWKGLRARWVASAISIIGFAVLSQFPNPRIFTVIWVAGFTLLTVAFTWQGSRSKTLAGILLSSGLTLTASLFTLFTNLNSLLLTLKSSSIPTILGMGITILVITIFVVVLTLIPNIAGFISLRGAILGIILIVPMGIILNIAEINSWRVITGGYIFLGIMLALSCAITMGLTITIVWAECGDLRIAMVWSSILISTPIIATIVGAIIFRQGSVVIAGTIIAALAFVQLGFYIGRQAISGDPKFAAIRQSALSIAALSGTNFWGADLSGANFTQATLKNTNFTQANLNNVRWGSARKRDLAYIEVEPRMERLFTLFKF